MGLILFGFAFYFLALSLGALQGIHTPTSVYFSGLVFLFTILPGIVLFVDGIRLIMQMQKRRGY